MDDNPYQSPNPKVDSDSLPTCNFCQEGTTRPVVQAPDQDVFICSACIDVAKLAVDAHRPSRSVIAPLLYLFFGMFMVIIVPVSYLTGDAPAIGATAAVVGTLIGLFLVGIGMYTLTSSSWQARGS